MRPCGPESKSAGSSPLARGLPILAEESASNHGIIPARAGFTSEPVQSSLYDQDHPRSRGVYGTAPLIIGDGFGSSPLARGLPKEQSKYENIFRIIPARAGFTQRIAELYLHFMDHPRSRGVYSCIASYFSANSGSSPLARGLLYHARWRRIPSGIIPARGGFTKVFVNPRPNKWDHPRSRGVYLRRFYG